MSAVPLFSLEGKVAIVTGASSGIGSAIAEAMSQAGAKVVLAGRDEERLQRCAGRCGEHRVVAVDLVVDDAPARIVSETLSAFGGIDSIVHSAGIFWSIAGQVAFPNSAAYCATKGAIEQLTKALAVELAPAGIRVNAIAPGNIRTPMNEELLKSKEYEQMYLDNTPYGRVGVVEDIAPLAVFLASDEARYIHGESILVDGGWAAR